MIDICNRIQCDAKDRANIENCRCGIMDAYEQGREDALNELLEKLALFDDREHGNEHFLFGIETCQELIEQMKEQQNEN